MKKLCKDQKKTLIGKLAVLFSGISADEINEVVDVAKNRLNCVRLGPSEQPLDSYQERQVKALLDYYTRPQAGGLRIRSTNESYLIRDVENGSARRNISSDNCVKQFKKQGRFGLS